CDLDGQRAEVRRSEGRLPHGSPRRHQGHPSQQAGRAARGCQAGGPDDCAPRREGAAAGLVMGDPIEPAKKPLGPSTMAVHAGEPRPKPAHSLATPIVQTATYTWANSQ